MRQCEGRSSHSIRLFVGIDRAVCSIQRRSPSYTHMTLSPVLSYQPPPQVTKPMASNSPTPSPVLRIVPAPPRHHITSCVTRTFPNPRTHSGEGRSYIIYSCHSCRQPTSMAIAPTTSHLNATSHLNPMSTAPHFAYQHGASPDGLGPTSDTYSCHQEVLLREVPSQKAWWASCSCVDDSRSSQDK